MNGKKYPGPLLSAQTALAANRAAVDPAIWISRVPDGEFRAQARALEAEGPRGRRLWGFAFTISFIRPFEAD